MKTSDDLNELDKTIMDGFYTSVTMLLLKQFLTDVPDKEKIKKNLIKNWKQAALHMYNANLNALIKDKETDLEESRVVIYDRVTKIENQLKEFLKEL